MFNTFIWKCIVSGRNLLEFICIAQAKIEVAQRIIERKSKRMVITLTFLSITVTLLMVLRGHGKFENHFSD